MMENIYPETRKKFTKKKVRSKKVIANHLQMFRSVFINCDLLLQKSKSRTFSKHLNQKKRIRTGCIKFFFCRNMYRLYYTSYWGVLRA